MKVIRNEGMYPHGGIENMWPVIRHSNQNNKAITRGESNGLFGHGHDWRIFRNFIQTDLLSPISVAGYIKPVIRAAKYASQFAPYYPNNANHYLNRCAFDLFSSILFGELMKSTNPKIIAASSSSKIQNDNEHQKDNIELAENTIRMLDTTIDLMLTPKEILLVGAFKIKSDKYRLRQTRVPDKH